MGLANFNLACGVTGMGELEYLRRLLGADFLAELDATMAHLLGRNAKFVIGVGHLHNSPRVAPRGGDVVELADVMFHLDFEYGDPGDRDNRLNEKRAYLFQVKQTVKENSLSTINQKALYEWQKPFRIESPLEIDSTRPFRDFSNLVEIKKSGFWYMYDEDTKGQSFEKILRDMPPRLEHRDGSNKDGATFGLVDFLATFLKGEAGRATDLKDDWSIFIGNIIKYKKDPEQKKWATTGSAFHSIPLEAASLNLSFSSLFRNLWKKVKSFFSRVFKKEDENPRPFILISIRVYTSEFKENVFWSIDTNRRKN